MRAEKRDGAFTVDAPVSCVRGSGRTLGRSAGSVHVPYCNDSEPREAARTVVPLRLRYNGR